MLKRLLIIAFAAVLVVAVVGCGYTKNGVKTNQYKARSNGQRILSQPVPAKVDGRARAENERKAKQLSTDMIRIKGVDKATVLVNNRDVVVGLDVKPGQNASMVAQEAKKTAEKTHPGHHVYVTTDKKMHQRVQTLTAQMHPLDGHPVRNFSEDVAILIRDVGRTVTAPFR